MNNKTDYLLPLLLLMVTLTNGIALYGQVPADNRQIYTGDNALHLDITTAGRPYHYVLPNLQGRLDYSREQFIFTIPYVTLPVPSATAGLSQAEQQRLLARFVDVSLSNPIVIIAHFPQEDIDLRDFKGQPLSFEGEVQLNGVLYKAPIQIQGLYQEDENDLILNFSIDIASEAEKTTGNTVEAMQLYAKGVTMLHPTNE